LSEDALYVNPGVAADFYANQKRRTAGVIPAVRLF
jgi:hypothetical protein